MTPPALPAIATSAFSPAQLCALQRLRRRYWSGYELFSGQERAHLRFVRWLHRTGRLAP
jgi:hypothetical protein